MSKIDVLLTMHTAAAENGDTDTMALVADAIDKLQDKQQAAFLRDRPQIMDAMERGRREMMVIHRAGETIEQAH